MRRVLGALLCGTMCGFAFAGDDGTGAQATEMDAATAEAMALMQPGEHHAHLDYLVGDWDYELTMWMSPEAEPTQLTGTASAVWVMDGRFVESTWRGEFMGSPFVGRSLDGYNPLTGKYESVWIDNQSPIIMRWEGELRDDGVLTLEGTNWDIWAGGQTTSRTESKQLDADTIHSVSYMVQPDGTEWKQMEIIAKRR